MWEGGETAMTDIQRVLRAASIRLWIIDLMRTLAVTLAFAAGVALLLLAATKLSAWTVAWSPVLGGLGGGAVVLAAGWSFVRRRRGVDLARVVDERAGLKESISTALVFERAGGGWSRAVVEDAEERARRVVLRDALPYEAPRLWPVPAALALVFAIVWFIPGHDMVSRLLDPAVPEASDDEAIAAKVEAEAAIQQVKEAAAQAGVDLDELFGDAAAETEAREIVGAEEVRRSALVKLTKASDELQRRADSPESKKTRAVERAFSNIRQPRSGPLEDFQRKLARADFEGARQALDEALERLGDEAFTEEERETLEEQLSDLAEQLEALAKNNEAVQDALNQLGMEPRDAAELMTELAQNPSRADEILREAAEQLPELTEAQREALREIAESQGAAQAEMQTMAGTMAELAEQVSELPPPGEPQEPQPEQEQQDGGDGQQQQGGDPQQQQQGGQQGGQQGSQQQQGGREGGQPGGQQQEQQQQSGQQGGQQGGQQQQEGGQEGGQQGGQEGGQEGGQQQSGQPGGGSCPAGSELSDQLGSMAQAQQSSQNARSALAQAQAQIQQLGNSMGGGNQPGQQPGGSQGGSQGPGATGQFAEGPTNQPGSGSGGAGMGNGANPEGAPGDFVFRTEQAGVEDRGGPIIGSTKVWGEQVRGESTAGFARAVSAAKANAAEAVENMEVPREYRDAVMRYFGRLDERARRAAEGAGQSGGESGGTSGGEPSGSEGSGGGAGSGSGD